MKYGLFLITVLTISLLIGNTFAAEQDPAALYLEGIKFFRQGDYIKSRAVMKRLLAYYPDSRYIPDSVFKIAEGYFRQKQYMDAGSYYRLYLERYSLGKNVQDAKLRLSQCEKEVGTKIPVAHPRMAKVQKPLNMVRVGRFYQKNWASLERAIAGLKLSGVTGVIIPGLHTEGRKPHQLAAECKEPGAYFYSKSIPKCKDLVPTISQIAHKYGMEVWVEFPIRSFTQLPPDTKWNPVQNNFRPSRKSDPFSPDAEKLLESAITELAAVSIDGILLTELEISPLEGYSRKALDTYKELVSKPLDIASFFLNPEQPLPGVYKYGLSEDYETVARAKASRLVFLADNAAKAAKKANPNLSIWVELSEKAIRKPETALLELSQTPDGFGKKPFDGLVVNIDPQAHTRSGSLTEDKLSASIRRLLQGAKAFVTSQQHLVLCVTIEDGVTRKTAPAWQLQAVGKATAKTGAGWYALYPLIPGYDYGKAFANMGGEKLSSP